MLETPFKKEWGRNMKSKFYARRIVAVKSFTGIRALAGALYFIFSQSCFAQIADAAFDLLADRVTEQGRLFTRAF